MTALKTAETPQAAIAAAHAATMRDTDHIIVTPDELSGTRVNHWLHTPIMQSPADGICLYNRTEALTRDGVVAVTASGADSPEWWIRGTDTDTERDRVCELRYDGRVIATYDLKTETITFEDGNWTEIERRDGEPAITPTTDHQTTPRPATWRPVRLPLTVPSTAPLTQSTVYALSDASGDGIVPVMKPSQKERGDRDTEAHPQQVTDAVSRVLASRTVESPTSTIDYDEFTAVCTRQFQSEKGLKLYTPELHKILTAEYSVTIQHSPIDGQRELCGRAWAVPPLSKG